MSKITNRIDIGDHQTSYQPYDVIVNLNYPYNGVDYGQLDEIVDTVHNKRVIRVGMPDLPEESENMSRLLEKLIPRLVYYYLSNPNSKILIHCYAGVSRSSTVAIALMMRLFNISAEEAFQIAKRGRDIVNPNQGFVDALYRYQNVEKY